MAQTLSNTNSEELGTVIVDDLMYLKSMRREVYTIARNNSIPILVVWINTPLSTALLRNSNRHGIQKIQQQVIEKIHMDFEPPSKEFIYDRNHVIIESSTQRY